MNIAEYESLPALDVFAIDYFSKNTDIRFSLLLSQVNKYWHGQFPTSIWREARKIYSLNETETSQQELKNRMLTDLINVCQPYKDTGGGISYTYFPIKQLGFDEISCIHYYARVKFEKTLWSNYHETTVTYNLNEPVLLPQAWEIDFPENAEEKEKFRNTTQNIDKCIKNNKKKFINAVQLKAEGNPGVKFSALPIEIPFFTGLCKLYLSYNKLRSLPLEIQNLKNLTYISLKSNCIKLFPEVLCNLAKLKSINLSDNLITSISDKITSLKKLKNFTLNDNKIISISESVMNLSLKTLNLLNNPIQLKDITGKVRAENLYINGQLKKSVKIRLKQLELEEQEQMLQQQVMKERMEQQQNLQPQAWQQFPVHQHYMHPAQQFEPQPFMPTSNTLQVQNFRFNSFYRLIPQEFEIVEEIPFFIEDELEEPVDLIQTNKRDNPFDDNDEDIELKKTRHK